MGRNYVVTVEWKTTTTNFGSSLWIMDYELELARNDKWTWRNFTTVVLCTQVYFLSVFFFFFFDREGIFKRWQQICNVRCKYCFFITCFYVNHYVPGVYFFHNVLCVSFYLEQITSLCAWRQWPHVCGDLLVCGLLWPSCTIIPTDLFCS